MHRRSYSEVFSNTITHTSKHSLKRTIISISRSHPSTTNHQIPTTKITTLNIINKNRRRRRWRLPSDRRPSWGLDSQRRTTGSARQLIQQEQEYWAEAEAAYRRATESERTALVYEHA